MRWARWGLFVCADKMYSIGSNVYDMYDRAVTIPLSALLLRIILDCFTSVV
jgi:hypothetical protein